MVPQSSELVHEVSFKYLLEPFRVGVSQTDHTRNTSDMKSNKCKLGDL
jgi:hypothetical protein